MREVERRGLAVGARSGRAGFHRPSVVADRQQQQRALPARSVTAPGQRPARPTSALSSVSRGRPAERWRPELQEIDRRRIGSAVTTRPRRSAAAPNAFCRAAPKLPNAAGSAPMPAKRRLGSTGCAAKQGEAARTSRAGTPRGRRDRRRRRRLRRRASAWRGRRRLGVVGRRRRRRRRHSTCTVIWPSAPAARRGDDVERDIGPASPARRRAGSGRRRDRRASAPPAGRAGAQRQPSSERNGGRPRAVGRADASPAPDRPTLCAGCGGAALRLGLRPSTSAHLHAGRSCASWLIATTSNAERPAASLRSLATSLRPSPRSLQREPRRRRGRGVQRQPLAAGIAERRQLGADTAPRPSRRPARSRSAPPSAATAPEFRRRTILPACEVPSARRSEPARRRRRRRDGRRLRRRRCGEGGGSGGNGRRRRRRLDRRAVGPPSRDRRATDRRRAPTATSARPTPAATASPSAAARLRRGDGRRLATVVAFVVPSPQAATSAMFSGRSAGLGASIAVSSGRSDDVDAGEVGHARRFSITSAWRSRPCRSACRAAPRR